jgi:ketosteroid isomerase-like protein
MSQENVETIQRAIAALNRGDLAGLRKEFSAEPTITPLRAALETETSFTGPRAVEEFWTGTQEDWVDAQIDVESIRTVGDRVLAIARYSGRTRTSGVPFTHRMAMVAEFENGKASCIRTYIEPREALEAWACRSRR